MSYSILSGAKRTKGRENSEEIKMPNCTQCGKQVSMFSAKSDFSGNSFCSDECKIKFTEKKNKEKEMKSKGMIKEIKCKCNQCGNVWHYLEEDEKKLKSQSISNAMIGCGMCCNPFGALFSNKSIDLQREMDKMKKCPKCNSTDVTRTPTYHEKRT
jgi:hypothetical protein